MTGKMAGGPLDVYLFPAVVGGGLGDIEEVLAAGRHLAGSGHRIQLYRARPLPSHVDGPWDWPPLQRVRAITPRSQRALTVSAGWGVACAPARDEPYGRAGAWALECAKVEAAYGRSATIHVSLEEFARTLTSRAQTAERWREGGVATREVRRRVRSAGGREEMERFHREYRKFRGFDHPNVMHVFATFAPSRAFVAEFPEAVQTGPLAPDPTRHPSRATGRRRATGTRRWCWYASPASSQRLIDRLESALSPSGPGISIAIRSPRPVDLPRGRRIRWSVVHEAKPDAWREWFMGADLRIVTGSRTLLEALTAGGPFLYFNGVTQRGRATRRHRPEKIDALLRVWRGMGVSPALCRDLADFSRARNVGPIARRALRPSFTRRFLRGIPALGFRWPRRSVGEVLDALTQEHARGVLRSDEIVQRIRDDRIRRSP